MRLSVSCDCHIPFLQLLVCAPACTCDALANRVFAMLWTLVAGEEELTAENRDWEG